MPQKLYNESYHRSQGAETGGSSTMSSVSSINMISPASMPSELNGAIEVDSNTVGQTLSQSDCIFLEDLRDILMCLKAQEASYERRRIRHQRARNISSDLPPFHDSWRPVMISWMYHVADTFRLMPIVVATAVYILDTCAMDIWNDSRTKNPREIYPLMTMTALNMAVKCHETKMFPLDQLVLLLGPNGRNSKGRGYTPVQICSMERKILQRCGWKLHKPTTHDYLLRFVEVLAKDQRDVVKGAAVMHLKRSLLWEHMAHQQQIVCRPFSDCTLAYGAFLLAMEDCGIPLVDKQSACLALLHVANLSAQTPMLSEAYNWLLQAQSLQMHLEQGKTTPKGPATSHTPANRPIVAVPDHVSAPQPKPRAANLAVDLLSDNSDAMSCDTASSMSAMALAPQPTHGSSEDADLLLLEFVEEKEQPRSMVTQDDDPFASETLAAAVEQKEDEDSSDDDRSTSLMSQSSNGTYDEVIFCSYSSDGDAFEVITTEYSVEDEDDHSVTRSDVIMSILPTVMEEDDYETEGISDNLVDEESDDDEDSDQEEGQRLVLTESLDEDGFEVAIRGKNSDDHLSGMVTSPREVSVTI